MQKPDYWSAEHAGWFDDAGVVAAYYHRPPYPDEVFSILLELVGSPRVVLDIGAGTGDMARPLADLVERVDAIEVSPRMIEEGNRQAGDRPNLRWIQGRAEDAPLQPPYGLVTAGESIHWMDWDTVLPRIASAVSPDAVLAIIERNWDASPDIRSRLAPIFNRHAAKNMSQRYDLMSGLAEHGFVRVGSRGTARVPWRPTVAEYLECRHSQNSFSRERMPDAAGFDAEIVGTLEDLRREGVIEIRDGRFELEVEADVIWGRIVL
jgi:SAM-dependent methyltransferase